MANRFSPQAYDPVKYETVKKQQDALKAQCTQGFETIIINGRKQLLKAEIYGWIESHPTYKIQSVKESEEKWLRDLRASIREETPENEVTPLKK